METKNITYEFGPISQHLDRNIFSETLLEIQDGDCNNLTGIRNLIAENTNLEKDRLLSDPLSRAGRWSKS